MNNNYFEDLLLKYFKYLAYFYKEQKTGKEYSRIFDTVAPVEQEGEHGLSWTADQVASLKTSAEKNYDRVHGVIRTTDGTILESTPIVRNTTTNQDNLDDIPF